MRWWWMLVTVVACKEPTVPDDLYDTNVSPFDAEATWLTSWSFGWAQTNHRLAAASFRPSGDGVAAHVLGGASSHGTWFGQETACNDGTCSEFPAFDTTAVSAVRADGVAGAASAFESATVRVDLDTVWPTEDAGVRGKGSAVLEAGPGRILAWIGGVSWDLQDPLAEGAADTSCYDPRHGWLPTRIDVEVTGPGDGTVVVDAGLAYGKSFEAVRACLDAAGPFARAHVDVDVVVLRGAGQASITTVKQGGIWRWSEGEDVPDQSITEGLGLSLDDDAVVGWTRWEWRFHEDVDPGRGAYLRRLGVTLDAANDVAYGEAQNVAPAVFLQSGFDMEFEGDVMAIDGADVEVDTRAFGLAEMPATIDAEGAPVDIDLTPGG